MILEFVYTQMSEAIRSALPAISAAGRSVFSYSARAAASAKLPPLPMARIAVVGVDHLASAGHEHQVFAVCAEHHGVELAHALSIRQSCASSTAARGRLPEYCVSLSSIFSDSANASDTEPAKPMTTRPL